jgi:serine/threonine-protein kinase
MPPPATDTLTLRGELRECPDCQRRFSGDAAFCPFDGVRLAPADAAPWRDPLVGTTVDGRYQVLDGIGEGGMGRVYRVLHAPLHRAFAMKVLRRDLASHADLAARFLHEARATAAIKHPNVVQITDFGHLPGGAPYFVMELLAGETLARAMGGRPLPIDRVVPVLRQIASALGAAHAAGVVHRDLKPDNVFLVGGDGAPGRIDRANAGTPPAQVWPIDPELRVVDFGAAKILGSDRITRAGVVFGTPHYMSPEQARGDEVDRRADVYALGVIVYQMLTGRVPFEADTYLGVLSQHMFAEPKPPHEVRSKAPGLERLEAIALRCLAKAPDDRFDSMEAILAALDGVELRSAGAAARAALVSRVAASTSDPPERSSRQPRAAAAVAGVAGALVLLALGAAAPRRPASARADLSTPSAGAIHGNVAPSPHSAPLPAASTAPREPAPLPSPDESPAPSGGSSGAAPPAPKRRSPPSPAAARRRPTTSAPAALDDVGDPFARAR